jgi:hypothetical protein
MSLFSDIFAAAGAPVLAQWLGAPVTYTTAAGVATTLDALVSAENGEEDAMDQGRHIRRVRMVSVAAADLPSPAVNATVTIGGLVYAVEAIESAGAMVRLRVVRFTRSEVSREGYRGK